TPAEYLAVMQVASGKQQSITLDAQGAATGGVLIINPHLSHMISSLVIPQNVSVIDLTRSGTLNLPGNITDSGNLYLASFNPAISTVNLHASNITVQAQGLISDVLPSGLIKTPDGNLNLNITTTGDLNNAGTISSAGSLNLAVGSGNITNSGSITSNSGNINISPPNAATNINVNANGGTFRPPNGAINFRDASYTGSSNTNINGGNWLSNELNINSSSATNANGATSASSANTSSPSGNVSMHVEELTGVVNVNTHSLFI